MTLSIFLLAIYLARSDIRPNRLACVLCYSKPSDLFLPCVESVCSFTSRNPINNKQNILTENTEIHNASCSQKESYTTLIDKALIQAVIHPWKLGGILPLEEMTCNQCLSVIISPAARSACYYQACRDDITLSLVNSKATNSNCKVCSLYKGEEHNNCAFFFCRKEIEAILLEKFGVVSINEKACAELCYTRTLKSGVNYFECHSELCGKGKNVVEFFDSVADRETDFCETCSYLFDHDSLRSCKNFYCEEWQDGRMFSERRMLAGFQELKSGCSACGLLFKGDSLFLCAVRSCDKEYVKLIGDGNVKIGSCFKRCKSGFDSGIFDEEGVIDCLYSKCKDDVLFLYNQHFADKEPSVYCLSCSYERDSLFDSNCFMCREDLSLNKQNYASLAKDDDIHLSKCLEYNGSFYIMCMLTRFNKEILRIPKEIYRDSNKDLKDLSKSDCAQFFLEVHQGHIENYKKDLKLFCSLSLEEAGLSDSKLEEIAEKGEISCLSLCSGSGCIEKCKKNYLGFSNLHTKNQCSVCSDRVDSEGTKICLETGIPCKNSDIRKLKYAIGAPNNNCKKCELKFSQNYFNFLELSNCRKLFCFNGRDSDLVVSLIDYHSTLANFCYLCSVYYIKGEISFTNFKYCKSLYCKELASLEITQTDCLSCKNDFDSGELNEFGYSYCKGYFDCDKKTKQFSPSKTYGNLKADMIRDSKNEAFCVGCLKMLKNESSGYFEYAYCAGYFKCPAREPKLDLHSQTNILLSGSYCEICISLFPDIKAYHNCIKDFNCKNINEHRLAITANFLFKDLEESTKKISQSHLTLNSIQYENSAIEFNELCDQCWDALQNEEISKDEYKECIRYYCKQEIIELTTKSILKSKIRSCGSCKELKDKQLTRCVQSYCKDEIMPVLKTESLSNKTLCSLCFSAQHIEKDSCVFRYCDSEVREISSQYFSSNNFQFYLLLIISILVSLALLFCLYSKEVQRNRPTAYHRIF